MTYLIHIKNAGLAACPAPTPAEEEQDSETKVGQVNMLAVLPRPPGPRGGGGRLAGGRTGESRRLGSRLGLAAPSPR
eukprot:2374967-Pyramimonas_sp.AAC.1